MISDHYPLLEVMSGARNFGNGGNGEMQPASDHWESGYAESTEEAIMQPPYAIQRFSSHPDDPYVAPGTIPMADLFGNQQVSFAFNVQNLRQDGFSQTNAGKLSEHAASYVDSGYGGSHVSYSTSSPSVQTGKSEDAIILKCMHCEHEAKNNSELRKHINRHNKPHKCDIRNCIKGFATQNDLDRHKRTVHRKELLDKGNTILYECLHCKDERGKSITRKKIEWPRKDNFLAHLDRIHHIRYKPSDNLDQYILRVQKDQKDLTDNMAMVCNQAQDLALQGIGAGADADLNDPDSRTAFSNLLVPDDEENDPFQQQRFLIFKHRNSRVLADASVLEHSTPHEFVSPGIVNTNENDFYAMGAGFHLVNDDGLQQPRAHSTDNMPPGPSRHDTNSDTSPDNHDHVTNQSDDVVSDGGENDDYVREDPQETSSEGNTKTTTSLSARTTQDPRGGLSGMAQTSCQSTVSEDMLRFLRQIPLETLQAELDSRGPRSDDGDTTATCLASKSLHVCPTCQKAFKRQCELTYVL
ncbi:hypothetical protein E4U41_005784 [Claviceps citrina]|nr:hypothetical protein E4U41_005784 [Claviceps citrina]